MNARSTASEITPEPLWTVGEVAELTRISIRALHHYDELGLLQPSERSEANYRLYTSGDLARLRRILTYRDLGFALAEIMRLLNAGADEERQALRLQAKLLQEQLRQTQQKLQAVTSLLKAETLGEGAWNVTREELKEIFDGFDHSEYEDEVQERWGDTAAYKQSSERTKRYTKADWQAIKAEADAIHKRFVALMDAGIPADSPQAAELAEAHRAHIHKWFYDCPPEMLAGVSNLWVNDPRFTKNIDKAREGLAAYQYAAVQAWAKAQGAS